MTSRRSMSARYSADELDGLIRWVLQERVAGAYPAPGVWERVCARVERSVPGSGGRFCRGYRAVVAELSRIGAFLSVQIACWTRSQNKWGDWRLDPSLTCLLDQYGFMLRFAF